MLVKAKQLIQTDLVKVSFLNAIATVVRMITGLVSVKVVATIIGPSGIALLGQLNNFSSIVLSLSNGGITAGMTKYISEHSDSEEKYAPYLRTGFWITVFLTAICSLAMIVGSGYFSEKILLTRDYKIVFVIFGLTLIFFSLNTLITCIINGFREYRKYVAINIIGSLVGLIFSVILALKYGLYGALISSVTFQSVVFFLTFFIVAKSSWLDWRNFSAKPNVTSMKNLFHYSLMAIASAVTVPSGQLIVRKYISQFSGIESAGLWEGINRISGMYLMVITTSLGVYFLPQLARLKTNFELKTELISVYKLLLPLLAFLTVAIYFFRHLIIRLLFSTDFAPMENLFLYQLIGDFFKIAGWVLGYLLLAKTLTKTYIFLEFFNFFLLTGICYFLTKNMGPLGACLGYTLVYFIYLMILIVYFRKIIFSSGKENIQKSNFN